MTEGRLAALGRQPPSEEAHCAPRVHQSRPWHRAWGRGARSSGDSQPHDAPTRRGRLQRCRCRLQTLPRRCPCRHMPACAEETTHQLSLKPCHRAVTQAVPQSCHSSCATELWHACHSSPGVCHSCHLSQALG